MKFFIAINSCEEYDSPLIVPFKTKKEAKKWVLDDFLNSPYFKTFKEGTYNSLYDWEEEDDYNDYLKIQSLKDMNDYIDNHDYMKKCHNYSIQEIEFGN